jgi:ABC-2 type transport system permease protein
MTGTTTDTGTTTEAVPDPRPGTAPGVVRQTWIITLRDLKHWQREPWTPLFGIAFMIMLVLIFGYLLGGAISVPGGGDYLPYLMPGMFALAMLFGLESTMSAVTDDAGRGITNRLRSLPISGMAVLGGRAAADMANSALQLAVLMIGGLVVGWRADAGAGSVLLAIALLLWLRFSLLWLGILLGLTFRGEGAVAAVQVLVWPIGLLSNVLVAPGTMPGWLGFLAEWNPVSATAAACRELFGNPTGATGGILADHALLLAALWPLVLTVVFVPLSVRAFRRLGG